MDAVSDPRRIGTAPAARLSRLSAMAPTAAALSAANIAETPHLSA